MWSRVFFPPLVLLLALGMAACGSSPTSAPVESARTVGVPRSSDPPRAAPARSATSGEIYAGPVAVAVAPVVDGRATPVPEVSAWTIQKLMVEDLARTDLFAGAIPLEHASEAHEGGILLQPALTALTWTRPDQGSGSLAMRIRASDSETGRLRLDRVYTASCRDCRSTPGQPPLAGLLAVLMQDVARDLGQATATR